jgi:hypothetical protein
MLSLILPTTVVMDSLLRGSLYPFCDADASGVCC